ncbi:splicing factor 3B subunit 5/RDS3 complex subunit 10 [Acaromyces ingoldii]|uniref:Splicing factor 3B subunit 5/RDS3 complex subunit 10 n=1 Tax=Acaromyces ingoldii TaxID=215250 RepID=A0A316YIK5_9BASI|nr:splicing factor 3B subunit 5/RDS3 complex subunit 10 [Acaromyces ingoldii]PWN88664.1 splicing factor 3B subunit 5/RDS3 complex subunit 10 [Acaromyces ingoldii]
MSSQLEHLHSRYQGTINPDITKHEWITHQFRDTSASIIGHPPLHSYLALADGECKARVKFELCEKMLQPTGPPPPLDE